MPIIVSNKQRIFFTVEGERGPFLLLHHGLFGSHHDWYEWGFVKALARDYRLVIPDARGHGRSDKPLAAEQYRLASFADDLIEILNELDIRNVNLIGYSLGAVVGFDLLSRYSGRVRGAILGGETPLVSEAAQQIWTDLAARLKTESLSDLVRRLCDENALACSQPGFPEDPINESAPEMLQAMGEWTTNDAEKIHVRSPLALFCGKEEPGRERIEQVRGRISQARMLPLESATTAEAMREPEALLREIAEFLNNNRRTPERAGASSPRRGSGGAGRRGGSSGRDSAAPAGEKSAPGTVQSQTMQPQTMQSQTMQPQVDEQVESPQDADDSEATAAAGAAEQPLTEDTATPEEHTATDGQEPPREDDGAAEREPVESEAAAATEPVAEVKQQPETSSAEPEGEKDSQEREDEE